MSRRQNYNLPRQAHELTFSCYHHNPFLRTTRTCQWLAESIANARLELNFKLWAFVFMPEHVHLLIYPASETYDIAEIRKAIKAPVARRAIQHLDDNQSPWLARISRQRGSRSERHFWQSGGGYDRNITESATLEGVIQYIHFNPVRRGLVVRPEDWSWSSASSDPGVILRSDAVPWEEVL